MQQLIDVGSQDWYLCSLLELSLLDAVWMLQLQISHPLTTYRRYSTFLIISPLLAQPLDQVAPFLGICNPVYSDCPPWERAPAFLLPIDSGQESHQMTLTFPTTPLAQPPPATPGLFI